MKKGIKAAPYNPSLFCLSKIKAKLRSSFPGSKPSTLWLTRRGTHFSLTCPSIRRKVFAAWALFCPVCLLYVRKGLGARSASGLTRRLLHPKATKSTHGLRNCGKDIHFWVIASDLNRAAHSQIRSMRHHCTAITVPHLWYPLELGSSIPSSQKPFLTHPIPQLRLLCFFWASHLSSLHPLHTLITIPTTLHCNLVCFPQWTFRLVLKLS